MGLFNFFKKSAEQTPTSESSGTGSQWDSVKDVPFRGDQATPATSEATKFVESSESPESKAARIKRQGDKILAAYLYDPTYLIERSVQIDDDARGRALDDLQSGVFSKEKQSQILQDVALPSGAPGQEDYGPVLLKISGRQPAKILAFATLGPAAADSIRGSEVRIDGGFENQLKILLQKYPTPIEFAPQEEAMMRNLKEAGNPPAKLDQYEDSFELFKESVYGKRYEYFQALEVLKNQALQRRLAQINEADRPRREAELRQLQTPVIPPQAEIENNPYMSGEQRAFYKSQQSSRQSPQQPPQEHA